MPIEMMMLDDRRANDSSKSKKMSRGMLGRPEVRMMAMAMPRSVLRMDDEDE